MFQKIVVAYDGSTGAEAALQRGIDLAKESSKDLWLVSVESGAQDFTAPMGAGEFAADRPAHQLTRIQDTANQAATRAGLALHVDSMTGNVAKSICEYAEAGEF